MVCRGFPSQISADWDGAVVDKFNIENGTYYQKHFDVNTLENAQYFDPNPDESVHMGLEIRNFLRYKTCLNQYKNGKWWTMAIWSTPHNPEVVGSSHASATRKAPDFDKKSGAFLTFWGKMKHPKKPVGLAVGLAPKKGVLEKGEFQTIS